MLDWDDDERSTKGLHSMPSYPTYEYTSIADMMREEEKASLYVKTTEIQEEDEYEADVIEEEPEEEACEDEEEEEQEQNEQIVENEIYKKFSYV